MGGKTPAPPATPKPPAPSDAASSSMGDQKAAMRRKGFSSTFLSGTQGVQNQQTGKTFLGQ